MFKFVETQKMTYLCESVEETSTTLKLKGAIQVNRSDDPDTLARAYVRAKLMEQTREVKVSIRSLESQEDAENVSPLVELMLKYIPIAEKQARARMILREVSKMAKLDAEPKEETKPRRSLRQD